MIGVSLGALIIALDRNEPQRTSGKLTRPLSINQLDPRVMLNSLG